MTHVFGWVWDGAHWITWLNSFSPQTRPLTDSVLHFHIVSTKVDFSQLHHRIHILGGKISLEENLTEHVTHVITDKDPTREEREPFSRGQLLLRKAAAKSLGVTEQAKELRVKLWNVTSFLRWVECQLEFSGSANLSGPAAFQYPEQKRNSTSKFISQLNIKVEDGRQRFKPQQKPLKEPYLHLDPEYPASPFDEPSYQQKFVKRERLRKLEEINNNNIDKSFKDAASAKRKEEQVAGNNNNNNSKKSVRANQPKQQFCECCNAYFLHLDEHLQSEQHRKFFGANEDHFRCVKDLIDKLHPQWMGTLPIPQDLAANVSSSSTPLAQGKPSECPAFALPLESSPAFPEYPPFPTGNQFNRKPVGRSVMHPASAAYALNMRQHMLNQAYRNATASAQQQTGIGPPLGLLGRQAGTNSGHYDHPPHHGVSGVNLKGAEVHEGAAVGGHRTGTPGGPGGVAASHNMASSSNPFQIPELLSNPESLLAAATSGVPLDFSRTSSQTFAAAMMRDFGHLPPPPISHPHMLSHQAAYNFTQAAASSHEKTLDDWLPKLQDQLNHSQQQQNSTQQALDMWGAALGQDQSSQAAQAQAAQAAQATADLFAALAGSAEPADFASLGIQNLLQTMVSVEEENRKRAQQIYNQANQQHQNHLLQSQTQSQHKKSDKAQHPLLSVSSSSTSHAPQNHHTQSQLIPNQMPPATAQTRQDAQEASLSPEEIVEENKFTPREAQIQPSPSQATPSPQGPNNRVARTPTYDSPLHVRSQYNSPLPKDEMDFQQPQQQQQQQQPPQQQKKAQNQHRLEPQGFNNQKPADPMKQFNSQQQQQQQVQQAPQPPPPPPQQQPQQPPPPQTLPDLQKYIEAPTQKDYVQETPPQQNQQSFAGEISGRQAAMNKYQEVVSPFDGQQGQKTPFYENPHSVPTPLQNPPSVPMNNPPSVPMNEGHTPQHTPHHLTHSNTPQHTQSPANLHGRALPQPQPPQQAQQQQQQQQQQQCLEKYDFEEELTEKLPPWQSEQATAAAAGEKQSWQNTPQFEAISSDNGKHENLMAPCGQSVGTPQDKEISAAAPYEKELPSKYLKGRGYQQPPIGSNQESNDQLSSQDSNSMQNSIASNTPQHSGAGLPTSFRYQNETSKDSLDLDKKTYPVQSAGSGAQESSSHNRWTAQRKSARGRYGGIKLKFTPAGRKSIAAGYNTSGINHSMFSPSQHSNAAKGDPYDWNEDEEVSVSPMKRKAAAQSSHLSFSQFTQKQQNVAPQDNMAMIGGYGSLQQSSGGQTYSQQFYHQQQQQHPLHHQSQMSQAYQQPGAHNNFQSAAGSSSAAGLHAASNPDQANEWKMKMVSETKIVLKKFNPPSGGKPASYKHPRKRHL